MRRARLALRTVHRCRMLWNRVRFRSRFARPRIRIHAVEEAAWRERSTALPQCPRAGWPHKSTNLITIDYNINIDLNSYTKTDAMQTGGPSFYADHGDGTDRFPTLTLFGIPPCRKTHSFPFCINAKCCYGVRSPSCCAP
ncbi:protein of unknown function [Burkholderia multivorans]